MKDGVQHPVEHHNPPAKYVKLVQIIEREHAQRTGHDDLHRRTELGGEHHDQTRIHEEGRNARNAQTNHLQSILGNDGPQTSPRQNDTLLGTFLGGGVDDVAAGRDEASRDAEGACKK